MSNAIYQENFVVVQDHLDDLDHVNNVVYLQWVQDIAAAHWNKIEPEGFRGKYIWVVLKHVIEYKKQARLGDRILLRTWVESIEGVRSDRCVEILRGENSELLCKCRTTWCLMDAVTQRPSRIEGDVAMALKK